MPTRIFAITAARETVTLDSQGRAEVSFTASNTGSKSIAGRAKIVPLGSAKAAWLSLEGEQERNFAKGEAHQLTVHIAVPPGTPVGKYSFRLNIISVENPDDEFTEGPSVSFEVKELTVAQAPARKFPWWIVAVAGVLVVGGGLITWLLLPPKVTMPNVVPPATVEVPPVVKKPTSEAKDLLKDRDLDYEEAGKRITGRFDPGVVVEQNPAQGAKVPPRTKVAVIVEAESVLVPPLIDHSIDDAKPILTKAKLRLETKAKPAGKKPGTIVDQNPQPNERVAPDTIITAFVEPEPEMVTVPDAIAVPAGKVAQIFQGFEGKLKYQVISYSAMTGKVPVGTIATQSPEPNQRVRVGTTVTLVEERDSIEVPDLIKKTVGEARAKIRSLHLEDFMDPHEEVDPHEEHRYTVYSQSPKAGTRVAPGTRVTIWAHFHG